MTLADPNFSAEDIAFDARFRIEDLVDRDALREVAQSIYQLFGIPMRIYNDEGALVADASTEHEVCAYVNTFGPGQRACGATVDAGKRAPVDMGELTHPCFTGQVYRLVPVDYEGRRVGKIILGPYAPQALNEVPATLTDTVPEADKPRLVMALAKVPRAKSETVARIAAHVKATLELIMFSGHKALATSTMHLASVRESFREMEDKNKRLQEAYDRLRELDRLKSNFLGTVSHELRTPLTSIIGYSEMLGEGIGGPLNEEQKEFCDTIFNKGQQLLELITSLLDLSKLESGTMTLRRKPAQIQPVLNDVFTTLKPVAKKRGVDLKLTLVPDAFELFIDPERLRQVFINIADNAMKFTKPIDGVPASVSISTRIIDEEPEVDDELGGFALVAAIDQSLEIRIADTGIGIPERERKKVFDPFYQVDSGSTREYGGTGLGLSIVKRLLEGHGGTVHIESNSPQGAVFVVRLPSANSPRSRRTSLPPPLPVNP